MRNLIELFYYYCCYCCCFILFDSHNGFKKGRKKNIVTNPVIGRHICVYYMKWLRTAAVSTGSLQYVGLQIPPTQFAVCLVDSCMGRTYCSKNSFRLKKNLKMNCTLSTSHIKQILYHNKKMLLLKIKIKGIDYNRTKWLY